MMTRAPSHARGVAVPSTRIARLARVGGLASGVAGSMAAHAARDLAAGRRPDLRAAALTPANVQRFTERLASMRGAAMKVGQLLSMEAGDILPGELTQILSRLRADAHFMPPGQLKSVLVTEWGQDFLRRFRSFESTPIAAASIGQVHRAVTRDGRKLAIKVQYPGVRRSIDSDVRNVAALIRMSGVVPRGLDLDPILEEARRQLHEEADYRREGRCLTEFGELLSGDTDFRVPAMHPDLSTGNILAMDFLPGVDLTDPAVAEQADRDRIGALLVRLVLRELFDFGRMQTDPNFANYRYDLQTRRVILLDFGATRPLDARIQTAYRGLLRAALSGKRDEMRAALGDAGMVSPAASECFLDSMVEMFARATEALRRTDAFDFFASDLPRTMRMEGLEMMEDPEFWHVPPIGMVFVQRKIGGIFLLLSRLRARVALRRIVEGFVESSG